jgi:hypothetical protein
MASLSCRNSGGTDSPSARLPCLSSESGDKEQEDDAGDDEEPNASRLCVDGEDARVVLIMLWTNHTGSAEALPGVLASPDGLTGWLSTLQIPLN